MDIIRVTSSVLQAIDGIFQICDACSAYMADVEVKTLHNAGYNNVTGGHYDIFVCSDSCLQWIMEDQQSKAIESAELRHDNQTL
jgi:hypothetical protein